VYGTTSPTPTTGPRTSSTSTARGLDHTWRLREPLHESASRLLQQQRVLHGQIDDIRIYTPLYRDQVATSRRGATRRILSRAHCNRAFGRSAQPRRFTASGPGPASNAVMAALTDRWTSGRSPMYRLVSQVNFGRTVQAHDITIDNTQDGSTRQYFPRPTRNLRLRPMAHLMRHAIRHGQWRAQLDVINFRPADRRSHQDQDTAPLTTINAWWSIGERIPTTCSKCTASTRSCTRGRLRTPPFLWSGADGTLGVGLPHRHIPARSELTGVSDAESILLGRAGRRPPQVLRANELVLGNLDVHSPPRRRLQPSIARFTAGRSPCGRSRARAAPRRRVAPLILTPEQRLHRASPGARYAQIVLSFLLSPLPLPLPPYFPSVFPRLPSSYHFPFFYFIRVAYFPLTPGVSRPPLGFPLSSLVAFASWTRRPSKAREVFSAITTVSP